MVLFHVTQWSRIRYYLGAIPELGCYRTPIQNTYMCGAGSHPGPGVSMAPGRNAPQVIFADLNLDFKNLTDPR